MKILITMILLLLALPAAAAERFDPRAVAGVDTRPGAAAPLDLAFTDDRGRSVRLGDYFRNGPVVLAPVYYTCPNLCGVTLAALFAGLDAAGLEPGVGLTVVAVSIRPEDTPADAARTRQQALNWFRRPVAEAGVHFLTGPAAAGTALTEALGYAYQWDATAGQFAHDAGIAVLTSKGQVVRWLDGPQLQPAALQEALADARRSRFGDAVAEILRLCYRFDPSGRRPDGFMAWLWRAGGILTTLVLIGITGFALWRESRQN